jgi:solute carrier family 25, member 39/40
VFALWRGLLPTLAKSIPSTTIYFAVYDELSEWMKNRGVLYAPAAAGMSARAVSATVVAPIELFRTRLMAEHASSSTSSGAVSNRVFQNVRSEWQLHGIRTLFRGLGPTLLRDVPFSGLYWSGYEYFKPIFGDMLLQHRPDWSTGFHTFFQAFAGGSTAGLIAAVLTTPADVVKTRQQIAMHLNSTSNSPGTKSLSAFQLVKDIIREDGVFGLFRGVGPRALRVAPACAVMISSYEIVKRYSVDGGT